MEELYLDLGDLKPSQKAANPAVPNLMDLLQPEGFIPDLNLAESVSIAGSPLNAANEAKAANTATINDSAAILSGIAVTLTNISENLNRASASIVNSTVNSVNNTLSIASDLVKIEPKKVDLSIKDVTALSDLIKNMQPTGTAVTDKTTPTTVSTKALTTATEVPAVKDGPRIDQSTFMKAFAKQEMELTEDVNSIIESGGDLNKLFSKDVTSAGNSAASGELSNKFSGGIAQGIKDAEKEFADKKEREEEARSLLFGQPEVSIISNPVNTPLAPVKEVESPNFTKAIAKGLTDVAESNSKIVSQTNIVNQNQAVQPAAQSKTIELLPTSNQSQTAPAEKEEDAMQATGAMIASDPTLASYMLQMLNIMKSGQLKVKISN